MKSHPFLIIGAGPTALGAALRLKELNAGDFCVLEASDRVGGLATSYTDDAGFVWDIGGHIQFSHYRYFDDLMIRALGDRWLHHERQSWVWIENRFVPYPLQNNIRYLSPPTRWKCLQGLVRLYRQGGDKPTNFKQWIYATFGQGLADVFMVPYNFKVWAYPAEMMDFGWVGERVAVTDLERVLDNVLHEKDDLSWGPNNTFQFPRQGGTGAVWNAVADLIGRESIKLNAAVQRVDWDAKVVTTADGEQIRYETLISTIPLPELIKLSDLTPLQSAAEKLKFSSSHIVGIGLTGQPPETLSKKCWMYFPEDNCPFYRVTVFSNYSPQNVPEPHRQWSLMAEVSESPHKPVDAGKVIEQTIAGLRATKLIDDSHSIASTWHYRAKYGYPTPSLGRDDALNQLHNALEKKQIYSRGRFGGWKYEVSNQDHSLMQGVELINRLVAGVPEVTYWFPNTANNLQYARAR